jgi:hypothetical protein
MNKRSGDCSQSEARDVVIPSAVFARVIQLMVFALFSIIIMWILFSLLLTGVIRPDFVKELMGIGSNRH